jgi:predicted amino acid-binding ACT domain protein
MTAYQNFRSLECILNSKLVFWYYRNQNNEFDSLFPKIKSGEIKALPIPDENLEIILTEKAIEIQLISQSLFDKTISFKNFISDLSNFKPSRKLQSWHELTFADFLKELTKAIKATNKDRIKEGHSPIPELTKKDEFEWMELFEPKQQEAQKLQQQIQQTEKEIDQMVYELYGLSEEEILIVENS